VGSWQNCEGPFFSGSQYEEGSMECKEEPLKAATGGATITIQTLSKSASARALHTDRHQWTHNICAAGIIQ